MKTQIDKEKLYNAKMTWRREMRKFFGKDWTKRRASLMQGDSRRQMNLPTT